MSTQPDVPDPKSPATLDDLLSIGDLAAATGIAPDTIRAWERRYGRPQAVRLPSGHRRYTPDDVIWLRRVAELLAQGHRPSKLVRLEDEALDALLAESQSADTDPEVVEAYLELIRSSAGRKLEASLLEEAETLGSGRFLEERLSPLLAAIGREWADGRLDIRHEHFASEVLQDVLRRLRGRCASPAQGPLVVLATLPEEMHGLGVQMLALQSAVAGTHVHILGVNTPIDEMVKAVDETKAEALAISISLATGGVKTDRLLGTLRRKLPGHVRILVGGAGARGARRGPHGVEYAADWAEFKSWLHDLADAV